MEKQNEQKQGFDFKRFIEDSKAALINPKEFFLKMPVTGGFGEPVVKALIYGAIVGVFALIWSMTGLRFASGPAWLGGGMGVMALIGSLIGALIGLFLGGVIMLIFSAILKGNTDYEANVRVVASLMVINVVSALFSFFDGINLYLGTIVGIAVSLWGLFMSYHALVETLKAKEKGSKILMLVLAALVVIFSFSGIAAKKMLRDFSAKYNIEEMPEKEHKEAAFNMIEKLSGGEIKADDMKKLSEEAKKIKEEYDETMVNIFTLEMADGATYSHPDEGTLKSTIEKLDDENEFMILTRNDDFMQCAYSDKGYTLEYMENDVQFEAKEL